MTARAGRRGFLAGALAVPATASLPAPVSADPITDAAQAVADAMQARHGGGRWKVTVDHEAGFVLMMPPLGRKEGAA
jgi:hypothetical protein